MCSSEKKKKTTNILSFFESKEALKRTGRKALNPSSKVWMIRFLPPGLWFIGSMTPGIVGKVAGDWAEGHFSREMVQGFHQILRVSTPALLPKRVKVPAPRSSQTTYSWSGIEGSASISFALNPLLLCSAPAKAAQGHGLIFFSSPGSTDPGDHAFSTPLLPFSSMTPRPSGSPRHLWPSSHQHTRRFLLSAHRYMTQPLNWPPGPALPLCVPLPYSLSITTLPVSKSVLLQADNYSPVFLLLGVLPL